MSKSAIYTTNTTGATVPVDGIIPVGNTTRRYGCNIKQDGNAITLCGQGYYLVNVSGTLSPSAAGTVSITAQKDGVPIIGATGPRPPPTTALLILAFLPSSAMLAGVKALFCPWSWAALRQL